MEKNNANKALKKGHLYFHLANNRVERITKLHSYGVVEHRHHDTKPEASMTGDFRLATLEEVMTYLGK